MAFGPEQALPILDSLTATDALPGYHLLPAARADALRRLGQHEAAAVAYRTAADLAPNATERAFLTRRRHEVEGSARRSLD